MRKPYQPPDSAIYADQLARLAELLRLEISEEDLKALSDQLRVIDALEEAELRDMPPILKMDADWHD